VAIDFQHSEHPRVKERAAAGPPRQRDARVGWNGRIAVGLTGAVGTMWCAYAFAGLALVALPAALGGGTLQLIQWLSQTFIQLVMLSVIMVGQNISGRAADRRAEMTYRDADALLDEVGRLQAHLAAQDAALNDLLATVARLEGRGGAS
jgi:hypothetical protein